MIIFSFLQVAALMIFALSTTNTTHNPQVAVLLYLVLTYIPRYVCMCMYMDVCDY